MSKVIFMLVVGNFILTHIMAQTIFDNKIPDDELKRQNERNEFIELNDSLFRAGRYEDIVSNCLNTKKYYLKANSKSNLMVAYYLLGDVAKSDSILNILTAPDADKDIGVYSSNAIFSLLNSTLESVHYFVNTPENKEKIEYIILNNYKQERITEQFYGQSLLKALFVDQFIRGNNLFKYPLGSNKKETKQDSLLFAQEDMVNREKVYSIYKQSGRIFSKMEIGSMYLNQFLLLAHEVKKSRRDFYLTLIKKAVAEEKCSPDRIVSFILRSEYTYYKGSKSDYIKHIGPRIEALKKEYNVPDYEYNIF